MYTVEEINKSKAIMDARKIDARDYKIKMESYYGAMDKAESDEEYREAEHMYSLVRQSYYKHKEGYKIYKDLYLHMKAYSV